MEIICPQCQFSRTVDESKIPAKSQVATCPKCQTKFTFRELPADDFQLEETPEAEAPIPSEPETPKGPRQGNLLTPDETDAQFPKMSTPDDTPSEGLWDKLDEMTPPEEATVRKPPVIGSKYNTGNETPSAETPAPKTPQQADEQPVPGWTGEFNNDFPDPMQDNFEKDQEAPAGPSVPPPFEQLDRYGFFSGLFLTIKLILTSPRLFFAVMPVGGGLSKPLTFTILIAMIQFLSQYFWGLLGLGDSTIPDSDMLTGTTSQVAVIVTLLFMPALIAFGQFIISGFYHLLLILMRVNTSGFEGTFRALAYANTPIILGIFPMPTLEISMAWMFVTGLWGLALTVEGLKAIHKTNYIKIIPVVLIPLLLGMIAMLTLGQSMPTI